MMFDNPGRFAAALVVAIALSGAAFGSEVSDSPRDADVGAEAARPEISVRVDEQRRVIIEDPANAYRLNLPAPYWECSTADQVAAKMQGQAQGPGCAGAGRIPPGLVLVVQNKDAPVQAILYLLPERFLLRGKEDIDKYVKARQEQIKPPRGTTVEFLEPVCTQDTGSATHRCTFLMSARGQKVRGLLVHYFVRPRDEKVRVYRLECMATEEAFERERQDIEYIVGSLAYAGELSPEFFTPDAPAESLPDAQAPASQAPACGQGYTGMLVAVLIVLMVYMFMRRRTRKSGV
jgi:hypothetical protein